MKFTDLEKFSLRKGKVLMKDILSGGKASTVLMKLFMNGNKYVTPLTPPSA